ncbi:HAD-IB family hydrolase [Rhodococcus sp. IEGM 1379]|uniref:HAD-IB family hydrolase n=1 Tax=Rhodococcus sp. IEGM 1379 TaxID=3047086 RepID=UPI0024B638CF|nr:HAD-IB family hydrolase [Rhodococcus sp. IEGM 1379]MDI9918440.1 HAD-IB family hydrolase [Rhodococcus sp. IEGM 1379]
MTGLERLHAAIAAAPPGPDTIAAFDLDGTLISGYSASVVYRDRLRRLDISVGELLRTTGAAIDTQFRGADVGALMDIGVRALAGRTEEELNDWGNRLFKQEIAAMIYPDARGLLAAHRKAGHTIVMATSATPFQARNVAEDLDIEDVLCTQPEVVDGMLTGELTTPALWGPAKANALTEYAEKRGAAMSDAFAYSNGAEDVPMLEAVGRPVALNPDRTLAKTARLNGWPSVTLPKPQRGATPISTIRTVTAMGALAATAVVGASAGLVMGNRQLGANLVGTYGPDISLSLLGIDVEIDGEHNVWDQRPAVFMFNHQSSLDMLVLGTVIKRDVTGVAKKEAANDPRFIPIGALLDVAYIDRSNTDKAKAALQPVVDKLKSGVSIVIAPEGTRSPTPKLGAFKKGAFHMAMQAGVPIVPVVIHNAGERMWRNSLVAHPGPVYVSVLDPIFTEDWKLEDLDTRIEEVRAKFEAALAAGHR